MNRAKKHSKILLDYLQNFVEVAKEEESSLTTQLIIDESSGSYLVLTYGWTAERFLHFVVFHFAIKEDGKIW
ncbi:MAG: element excision factor XisI family protein, partial [Bacteroidota bacterium]